MKPFAFTLAIVLAAGASTTALAQTADKDVAIQDMKSKKLKGMKKIFVEQFTVNFALKQTANASSSALRSSAKSVVSVAAALGVSTETLQGITDRAYAIFLEKAKANGFEVVDQSILAALPVYDPDNKRPYAPIAMPEDISKEDIVCATAAPQGFTNLIPTKNPMKLIKGFKGQDVLAIKSNLNVSFVDFATRSSKIGVNAKINWKEDIALSAGIACPLKIFGGIGATNVMTQAYTQMGYGFSVGLKQDLKTGNELGEWVETYDSQIGLLGYNSKFSGQVLKIDQAQYAEAVLAQVNRYWDYYFQERVRVTSDAE